MRTILCTIKGDRTAAENAMRRRDIPFTGLYSPAAGGWPLCYAEVSEVYAPTIALWFNDSRVIPGYGYAPGTLLTYRFRGPEDV